MLGQGPELFIAPFSADGEIRDVSVAAAKQLNRRALDIFIPELVAFGTFKVSLASEYVEPHGICELHEIVAEAEKSDLEKAFFIGGQGKNTTARWE